MKTRAIPDYAPEAHHELIKELGLEGVHFHKRGETGPYVVGPYTDARGLQYFRSEVAEARKSRPREGGLLRAGDPAGENGCCIWYTFHFGEPVRYGDPKQYTGAVIGIAVAVLAFLWSRSHA